MAQITQMVCLANSYKGSARCIAGIDLATGQWVRPIGCGHEGAIEDERIINGAEPEILDVLQIEFDGDAEDNGCQPENKSFTSTPWSKIGRKNVCDIMNYIEGTPFLLHNHDKKVDPVCFENEIPELQWKSLQLIQVSNASFSKNQWDKIECNFRYSSRPYTLKTPCPEADKYLGQKGNFILTISMAAPYARNTGDKQYCYKMVAGAIRL